MLYETSSEQYLFFLTAWQTHQSKWNRKYGDPENPTTLIMGKDQNYNYD